MGFSLKVTNNISTDFTICPILCTQNDNVQNTNDDAKLINRNKHSVLYTTIRHAIRHITTCLTTLSHGHRHNDVYNPVSRLCLTTVSQLCLTTIITTLYTILFSNITNRRFLTWLTFTNANDWSTTLYKH
jgi:Gpi18-like mannosyltransferase